MATLVSPHGASRYGSTRHDHPVVATLLSPRVPPTIILTIRPFNRGDALAAALGQPLPDAFPRQDHKFVLLLRAAQSGSKGIEPDVVHLLADFIAGSQ